MEDNGVGITEELLPLIFQAVEIARILGISLATIETRRKAAMRRIDVHPMA